MTSGPGPAAGLLIGYRWEAEDCFLQVQPVGTAEVADWPVAGRLALRVTDESRCAGWIDLAHLRRRSCPDGVPGVRQCQDCRFREGFGPCVRCDGFSCPPLRPDVGAYCRSEHYLYLALFGPGELKVGTASAPRKAARVAEQGPRAAVYVARGDGPTIKQMESLAVGQGFTGALTKRRKARLFGWDVADGEAARVLEDARAHLERVVGERYGDHLVRTEHAALPRQQAGVWGAHRDVVTLAPGSAVSGRVVAAAGSCVVLDDGAGEFLVELSAAVGHVVDPEPATVEQALDPRQLRLL